MKQAMKSTAHAVGTEIAGSGGERPNKQPAPYTEGLKFTVPRGGTRDADAPLTPSM